MSARQASYGQLHRLRFHVNRLIELLLDRPSASAQEWLPATDLVEMTDTFELHIELPGILPDRLQLTISDQKLLIRGKKERLVSEPSAQRYHFMERYVGAFQLEVEVPGPVHPGQSAAQLNQGVLTVILPKLKEKRHRTYSIDILEESEHHG